MPKCVSATVTKTLCLHYMWTKECLNQEKHCLLVTVKLETAT